MSKKTIWKELTTSFGRSIHDQRKLKYFRWKHGIDTDRNTYSQMTKEQFMEWLDLSNIEFINLEKWESSAKYKRLTFLLKEDCFANDLLEVYDATKELATKGDSQAIKNMLLLQKEIKKYREDIDEFKAKQEETEEDDGLTI